MPRAGRPWTREEVAFLEQNRPGKTIRAIAETLGRTEASVERKLRDGSKHALEHLRRDRGEMTRGDLERANKLHIDDLKSAGHTWWHRIPAAEPDVLPSRIPTTTFSHSSCIGSPAAMCAE